MKKIIHPKPMTKDFIMLNFIIGICILMVFLSGCSSDVSLSAKIKESDSSPISEPVLAPVKIAILLDDTGSVRSSRIDNLTPEDLQPLIDLLNQTGGELAFGFIRDESNRPLLRLHIDPPPVSPSKPSRDGNPFEVAERMNDYEIKRKIYLDEEAAWKSDMEKRIVIFLDELKNLLATKVYAKRTDIWGAIRRSELFLCEDDLIWSQKPKKYAIFITDGLDNVRKQEVSINSGAKLILVNGTGSLGVFHKLDKVHFESVEACFSFVSVDGRRR